ncbi:hypothetical protein [Kibdelosporangium philippinense]|uniref:hypothetical protein n=1 Tax=Kibdelosporangium philippinense TaxID=211113 RepID=UPI003616A8BE
MVLQLGLVCGGERNGMCPRCWEICEVTGWNLQGRDSTVAGAFETLIVHVSFRRPDGDAGQVVCSCWAV